MYKIDQFIKLIPLFFSHKSDASRQMGFLWVIKSTWLLIAVFNFFSGVHRAEWGLDSVIIGVNETNRESFQDDFAMMVPDPHHWLLTESAVPRITCNSVGNALEFSRDKGE